MLIVQLTVVVSNVFSRGGGIKQEKNEMVIFTQETAVVTI